MCHTGAGRRAANRRAGGDRLDDHDEQLVRQLPLPSHHLKGYGEAIERNGHPLHGRRRLARDPHPLAGVVAFDPATSMARRYWDFASLPGGSLLQRLAREEIGGTPLTDPAGYASRSPGVQLKCEIDGCGMSWSVSRET